MKVTACGLMNSGGKSKADAWMVPSAATLEHAACPSAALEDDVTNKLSVTKTEVRASLRMSALDVSATVQRRPRESSHAI
jgi:hypothetical protein